MTYISFFISLFLVFVLTADDPCKHCFTKDDCIDLTELSTQSGGNDVETRDGSGNTYYYRPCKILQQSQCLAQDPSSAICQKDTRTTPQYHDCGSAQQATWKKRPSGGPGAVLEFDGGEEDRKSDIEFICQENGGTGNLQAQNPAETPTHFYHLEWTSQYVCPTHGDGDGDGDGGGGDGGGGGGISGGWIFIIILFSLIFLYFVCGVLFQAFYVKARGLDMIPQKDFWFALPGLFIAGHVYTYTKIRGLFGARYDSV